MSSLPLWNGALRDGTTGIVRPISPVDAGPLADGLRRLSPESRVRRFLYEKYAFTERELRDLTQCDGFNHIALLFVVTGEGGVEVEPIGVARSIRDGRDPKLAEVAVAVVDAWQNLGAGTVLLKTLAREAWRNGIRRWQAATLEENTAARALLERVGANCETTPIGSGAVETICEIQASG